MGYFNKRRRKLLWKALQRIDYTSISMKYIINRWNLLRLDKLKTPSIPYPTNFMLELGNVCNLHCTTCPREYEYGRQMDVGFMPYDKAVRIIDEVIPYLDSIGLTGLGETFLYPRMTDIAKYIKGKKKSIIITVSTNAHFKDYIEKVRTVLPYMDNIQFSVDGVHEVYERIRPGTDFGIVKENIRATMRMAPGLEYMINCVVSDLNHKDMPNVLHLANELGIRHVNYNTMSIACMPHRQREYYGFFRSGDFLRSVGRLREASGQYPQIEVTGPLCQAGDSSFRDCIYPWSYPYITWDGYYVPCCGKPFPKLLNFGNVFTDGGVMQVLNSKKAEAFRRLWQRNQAPAFCHNCQLVDF